MEERNVSNKVAFENELEECTEILTMVYLRAAEICLEKGECPEALAQISLITKLLKDNNIDIKKSRDANFKVQEKIKRIICDTNYIEGRSYEAMGDDKNAIDAFEIGVSYNHGPSLCALVGIYSDNSTIYYNPDLAECLAERAINGEYCNSQQKKVPEAETMQYDNLLYLANRKAERGEYQLAINFYEKAKEKASYLSGDERDSCEAFAKYKLEETIEFSEGDNKKCPPYFEKKARELFSSEKAKKYITEKECLLIGTSMVTSYLYNKCLEKYGFELEYSGAIISLLKCLEMVLFDVLGDNFLKYCRDKKIPFDQIPRSFYYETLDGKEKKCVYREGHLKHMEIGSYIEAIRARDRKGSKGVRGCFLSYMEYSTKIKREPKIYLDMADKLDKIRRDYRNPAAHRDWIGKDLAGQCFKYLFEETIRFIENFINIFYQD